MRLKLADKRGWLRPSKRHRLCLREVRHATPFHGYGLLSDPVWEAMMTTSKVYPILDERTTVGESHYLQTIGPISVGMVGLNELDRWTGKRYIFRVHGAIPDQPFGKL